MANEKDKDKDKDKAKAIKDSRKKDNGPDDSDRKKKPAPPKQPVSDDGEDDGDEQLSTIDPRQFVVVNPDLDMGKGMNESRSVSQIDYLIRLGLGDQDHLTYYRKVLSNPKTSVQDPVLRKYVGEVLDELLDIIFSDSQMYNRLRNVLDQSKDNHKKIEDAIIAKAHKSGYDVRILREVFSRGLDDGDGNVNHAFNRLNSFLAGGRARKLDSDLLPQIACGQKFQLIKKAMGVK